MPTIKRLLDRLLALLDRLPALLDRRPALLDRRPTLMDRLPAFPFVFSQCRDSMEQLSFIFGNFSGNPSCHVRGGGGHGKCHVELLS